MIDLAVLLPNPFFFVFLYLVPATHLWIFSGQLKEKCRSLFTVCRHPCLHTLQRRAAGNFCIVLRFCPEYFTREVSCLRLVELPKPASFQAPSLQIMLHYLNITFFFFEDFSNIKWYQVFTDRSPAIKRRYVALRRVFNHSFIHLQNRNNNNDTSNFLGLL